MLARRSFATVCCLTILGLVVVSCAPTVAPTATSKPGVPPDAKAPTAASKPAASPGAKPVASTPSSKPASTESGPRYGGILTISTVGDPLSFDMHQESSQRVEQAVQLAYSNVTQFDPNSPEQVIGDLAKSWEVSQDGLIHTFHLYGNVKFHDGTAFTAEDVRYSFERQINPPRGVISQRRSDIAAVDRVESPDKETVKFVLKYPSSSFLSAISSGWMVVYSRAFVEKKGHMKNDVMGTGPYKFKSYTSGTSLEYVKNPGYFVPGRPYVDGTTFYIIRDAATRLAAFRTGRVKLTGPGESALTPADAEIIKKTMPEAIVTPYPSNTRAGLTLNTQQAPWTDARVRKAVHLAMDRQIAIDVLGGGYGELGSFVPGTWGVPKEELLKMPGWRQPKDADIAEARRLLAEAGFPNGFTAKALVVAQKRFEEQAVYVADQMSKIGIKVELDVKEMAVRTALLNQGAFSLHPTNAGFAYPDPQNEARWWAAPVGDAWGMNWQRYSDPKIWDLFEKQSRTLDPAERMKVVRELDLRLIEAAAQPVIFWRDDLLGMWPEVKNRGKLIGMFSFQKYQDIWLAK
ncbi:MAG: hypothetical protein HYX92_08250 [Chloroflexi bacterium]|nr:hypothetical protein [Chloroflexota bacterium]